MDNLPGAFQGLLHHNPAGKGLLGHLTDEETGSERESTLPRVTQLRIQIQLRLPAKLLSCHFIICHSLRAEWGHAGVEGAQDRPSWLRSRTL